MPLPVLPHATSATPQSLVRLFHQSQLEWCRHVGTEFVHDAGTFIHSKDRPDVPDANCFLEARILPGTLPEQLLNDADSIARELGSAVRLLTLSPALSSEQDQSLADALARRGWQTQLQDILLLRRYQTRRFKPVGLTVIPARAAFQQYEKLMTLAFPGDRQAVEAAMLHLDDSHFEASLALQDGKAVATIGLLTSGEIGTVRQWYVAEPQRRRGIGRSMLEQTIDLCGRATLRSVMIAVPADCPVKSTLSSLGFEKIGEYIAFTAPEL